MPYENLRTWLSDLGIPIEGLGVLGVWPTSDDGRMVEIQLGSTVFWDVARRTSVPVRTTEHPERVLPYTHRLTLEGVDFFTFSGQPVLPPGTVTPGYALRLT